MRKLVIDIGLNNGNDAAYDLHLGHRVVGVEANPLLAAECSQRFQAEIAQGKMAVVNAGVMRSTGEFTFYRSLHDDGWSTFTPDKNRKPGEWQEMSVSCITAQQLIADHGKPHFMKVDIEGADFQVLETLTPDFVPAYIRLELNATDPFLDRLVGLGYTAFKFVDGKTFSPSTPIFNHQTGWRFLIRVTRAIPICHRTMCALPQRLRPKRNGIRPGPTAPTATNLSGIAQARLGKTRAARG